MKKGFRRSVSFKILVVPMIIMFVIIMTIAAVSVITSRNKILSQMKSDGINMANQISKDTEKNNSAVDSLNESIDNRIETLGDFIVANSSSINNSYLKTLAEQFQVDEINYTDASGKIIYSNLNTSIGYVFDSKSLGYPVLKGEKDEFMEEIRKSSKTNDYYKYGYIKNTSGGMVQIGILANRVQKLTDSLKTQTIVEDMVKNNKSMIYALYMDKDLKVEAHSDKSRLGITLSNIGSKAAVTKGKVYTSQYEYKNKIPVYDVIVPVHKNGQIVGAIDVGMSMENVNKTVYTTIMIIVAISIVAFIIFAAILTKISKGITVPLKHLVDISKRISEGELNNEINISSSDEIGLLASSFKGMADNLKNTISAIKSGTLKVNTMSQELTSSSEEMTNAASDVARAIQDVAHGATEEANDLVNISNIISKFAEQLQIMNEKISKVNESSNKTEIKVTKGKEEINVLLESINTVNKSFTIVADKINNLNSSVSKVGNITEVINGVSEQTNLLALNAAIEAARAGEAGKGFAVVAEEVRKLAEQTKESTEQIYKLVESISSETKNVMLTSNDVKTAFKEQSNIAKNTIEAFEDMLSSVKAIAPLVDDTYKSIEIIMNSKEVILEKIDSITAISEESSASSEEISASSEEMYASSENVAKFAGDLNSVANKLNGEADKFKI
ncbi:chemotaxis protein [Clostridium sp. DMHC 10]|uniref:methyl-accepting chemotaxis protein n=1 Tax=Clostridium sp. DMHC 10 TaxID=747377 RepID=UPI00069F366D|nr:methyl-accepting chemotaxis protein [Clostridium sp. DMHC 10]KOF56063.1 chemotaxis protein [Clostridium sp. DMHC 10]